MKKLQYPQIIPTQFGILDILKFNKDIKKTLGKIKTRDEISIVYFGTPEFSAYILEALIKFCQSGQSKQTLPLHNFQRPLAKVFEVQTVITRPDKPVGRKQTIHESPVALVAKKYGIPTLKPTKLDEEFMTAHSSLLTSHLFVLASYGKIIPQALLDTPILGAINVHGSMLPKYRGASPIQSAILNGDKKTGVTIMLMDSEIDHGLILSTKEISISESDTFETLSKKMSQLSASLLIDTIGEYVDGKIKGRLQNHKKATFCKLLKKDDGYFDINNPPSPKKLGRMIRAYYPWPGTWCKWSFDYARDKKGKIVKFYPGGLIQMEGKKPVPLKDFLNGYPDFPLKSITIDKK